jgi:hypothetical protein
LVKRGLNILVTVLRGGLSTSCGANYDFAKHALFGEGWCVWWLSGSCFICFGNLSAGHCMGVPSLCIAGCNSTSAWPQAEFLSPSAPHFLAFLLQPWRSRNGCAWQSYQGCVGSQAEAMVIYCSCVPHDSSIFLEHCRAVYVSLTRRCSVSLIGRWVFAPAHVGPGKLAPS